MTDPTSDYSTAKAYVQSAYLIMTNPIRTVVNDDRSFILSYHMLLGFAVELYLKAFLQHTGHTSKELRSAGVRHSLTSLLALASADGFDVKKADALVQYLNGQHGNFEYRYVNSGSQYTLRWQRDIFAELSALDHYVDGAIGASKSHGKLPQPDGWTIADQFNGWRLPTGSYTPNVAAGTTGPSQP